MKQNKVSVLRAYKTRKGAGLRLAESLNAEVNTCKRSPLKFPTVFLLNWGRSKEPVWLDTLEEKGVVCINHPSAIKKAVDKLECLKVLTEYDIPTLKFTEDEAIASLWYSSGYKVFCRTLTNASRGKGIVISEDGSGIVKAPLYTRGFNKTHEFRVHVIGGQVIDYVQKKKRSSDKLKELGLSYNSDIRNLDNGSVFCRDNIIISDMVKEIATSAVDVLGLDFGAVDVLAIVDKESGEVTEAVVCEINTAPQLKGSTLNRYVDAFEDLCDRIEFQKDYKHLSS